MIKVVHCKKSDYDIYIGRGKCPKTGRYSSWANPFRIGLDGDRENIIKLYLENLIINRKDLLERIFELENKVLGCWCHKNKCHGDVLYSLTLYHQELKKYNLHKDIARQLKNNLENIGIEKMIKRIYERIKNEKNN